jgi:uncharacterized membrane protein
VPFVIRWIDEVGVTAVPTAAYGLVLAMSGLGYSLLQSAIVACNGHKSALATAIGSDVKGKASLALYTVSVPLAFVRPWISIAIFVLVALMWFVPDSRIERRLKPGD